MRIEGKDFFDIGPTARQISYEGIRGINFSVIPIIVLSSVGYRGENDGHFGETFNALGDGVDLHPLLAETIAFACGARGIQPKIIHKGYLPYTDWFGPLEPCRPCSFLEGHSEGIINEMKKFNTAEFVGVAEDFCDYGMKIQTLCRLEGTPYVSGLRFLTDCTVPIVPNDQKVLDLNARALKAGVRFITHDEPF